jgi:hypothetical protein
MIKSRKIRWIGHVAHTGDENSNKILRRDHLEELTTYGKIC